MSCSPDAIIFDLDGTLWDSGQSVAESWTQTLSHYPQYSRTFIADDIHAVMGMTMSDIGIYLFGDIDDILRVDIIKRLFSEECNYVAVHGGYLYPHLENVLASLSAIYPLYIVSNCQSGYIEAFFEYSGLGKYFADFENYGRTGLNKSGSIRVLMKRCGIAHPIYVGDTYGDFTACNEAGIDFIHAAYGFGKVDNVRFITSISDLPVILSEFID